MKIQIFEKSGSLVEAERSSIEQQLLQTLSRFEEKISDLTVTLSEINGTSGGRERLCRLRMVLSQNGEIVLSDNSPSAEEAVAVISIRAANTVQRLVERRRLYERNAGVFASTIPATTAISA